MIVILACGGRDYSDRAKVFKTLDKVVDEIICPVTLMHGGANGADKLAAEWANYRNIPVIEVRADWTAHGRAAGPIRNQKMLDAHCPKIVIAFAGGRGTADMVRRSRKAGIQVIEVTA